MRSDTDSTTASSAIPVKFGEAMMMYGEERNQKLDEVAAALLLEMETLASRLKDLILSQSSKDLLGYLWNCLLLQAMNRLDCDRGTHQLAMEYVHAVLSSFEGDAEKSSFDEKTVTELLDVAGKLKNISVHYCMATSNSKDGAFGEETGRVEFTAKTNWITIRGQRYQALEEEFFQFVLSPHDEAFRRAYGIGAEDVAHGIQEITDSMRKGFALAAESLQKQKEFTYSLAKNRGITLDEAIKAVSEEHSEMATSFQNSIADMFHGGICNLSRHTTLPEPFLADLSYRRGENREFFEPGIFCGTPLRTLPARIKPLIQLDDGFYATDPQFVRDAAYRAIQRGLLNRLPDYREEWKRKQTTMSESAFPLIFEKQLHGATVLNEVYYQDVATGQWVENDTLILLDDVMLQIKAKGGIAAMHSPASNFQSHVRAIQGLVVNAYIQTKRFFDYLNSAPEVALYELSDGKYVEVCKIRLSNYRLLVPIGLTVENFSPFSTMCKDLPEVQPLLGKHPFVSMSIDDLFVLTRFLPTAGELLHYLEVRQTVASIKKANIFDEIDHLGSYISQNRFDITLREQFDKGANLVVWDSFSSVVDDYFEKHDWQTIPPPNQEYPITILQILAALDRTRAVGWLKADSVLRDLGSETRSNLAENIENLTESLSIHSRRYFVLSGENTILFWLFRNSSGLNESAIIHEAEVAAIAARCREVQVIMIAVNPSKQFAGAKSMRVKSPTMLRTDYGQLVAEAEKSKLRTAKNGLGATSKNSANVKKK